MNQPPIPFLDLKPTYLEPKVELDEAISRVLDKGWYILGNEVSAFEGEFAAYVGTNHCVGVGNGLDALTLVLMAYGIKSGDEVIVSSNTYIATALAVSRVGAKVVFVEPDPKTHNLDPDLFEQAITEKTRAVIPVHLYGLPADMDSINGIAGRYNIRVIEDACQAHGAQYKNKKAGALSDAAAFSFYPGKNLGAFGDGGMVLTDDPDLAQKIKRLADYGQTERHVHTEIGYNSRLDTLQAAVLLAKLPYLPQWTKNRRRAAKWYDRKLSSLSVTRPATAAGAEPVYHLYAVLVEDRDDCLSWLRDRGVMAQVHYHGLIHLQECYNHLGYKVGNFPVAEKIHKHSLSLPLYPEITEQQINRVVDVLGRFPAFK